MILFFDVETTGLPTRYQAHYSDLSVWPRIVSISWALFRGPDSKIKHRHMIIRPDGFVIPEESTRIHGITNKQALSEGESLRTVLSKLLRDIELQQPDLVVSHNIDFDRPILLAEFLRAHLDDSFAELPTFCTMVNTTELCCIPRSTGGYKWPSLDELHRHLFGTGVRNAHSASADVLSCAKCYFELQRMGLTDEE